MNRESGILLLVWISFPKEKQHGECGLRCSRRRLLCGSVSKPQMMPLKNPFKNTTAGQLITVKSV
jgi:hypothetical protein